MDSFDYRKKTITKAVKEKRYINVIESGFERKIEPHGIYQSNKKTVFDYFEADGETMETLPIWFEDSEVKYEILDETFKSRFIHYEPNKEYDEIIAGIK